MGRAHAVVTAVLLVGLGLALFPVLVGAHGGTGVTVGGEVRPDGPIEVTGEEFAPNDHVRIELRKGGVSPIELGIAEADGEGAFTATFHIPTLVAPGLYELAAEGEESATAEVTILEPAEGGSQPEPQPGPTEPASNDRPAGEIVALAAFTGVVGLAAFGLLWLSRTRPRSAVM